MAAPGRVALYLRVSTGRQAEYDLSIHDQRRQLRTYCEAKGIEVVAEFVALGASATDDRRPEFQRMMDAASEKPAPFDTIIAHSFFHKSPVRLPAVSAVKSASKRRHIARQICDGTSV